MYGVMSPHLKLISKAAASSNDHESNLNTPFENLDSPESIFIILVLTFMEILPIWVKISSHKIIHFD